MLLKLCSVVRLIDYKKNYKISNDCIVFIRLTIIISILTTKLPNKMYWMSSSRRLELCGNPVYVDDRSGAKVTKFHLRRLSRSVNVFKVFSVFTRDYFWYWSDSLTFIVTAPNRLLKSLKEPWAVWDSCMFDYWKKIEKCFGYWIYHLLTNS